MRSAWASLHAFCDSELSLLGKVPLSGCHSGCLARVCEDSSAVGGCPAKLCKSSTVTTGYAGGDGLLLRAPAGEGVGWFVTLVGALPPTQGQTVPLSDFAATELAQLLGGGTACELIPELVRQGL